MKKFIITEEEKSQILSLYKSKKLIIEQEVQGGKVVYNNITTSDDKGFNLFTKDERAKTVKPKFYVGSDFFKKTLESYEVVTDKIDSKDTESLRIWNILLGEGGDQIFAANCIYYVQSHDWVEVVELTSKLSKEEEGLPPDTKFFPGSEVSIPKEEKTNKYFEDNQWILNEFAKNDLLTNIINPLVSEKNNREGCIDLIQIESSASRYRNTETAKDLSFLELSQKRNDAVKDFIYEQLKSKGFEKWCKGTEKIVQVTNGSNGDGTSGPNAPAPTPFIIKGQQKMEPASNDESKRNEFGTPHPKLEDYDVYKYSRPTVRVAYKEITPPTDNLKVPQPSMDTKTKYQVIFKGNVGILKVPDNKPKQNIGTSNKKGPRMKIDSKTVSCPVFG
jgi:hypothetical protein